MTKHVLRTRRPRPCAARRHPNRAQRAALLRTLNGRRACNGLREQRRVRAGCGAPVRRRGAQGSWPRAQRASMTDSSRLSERRERSERSELSDGPRDRAPQGSRSAAETASAKRRGLPVRAFARADLQTNSSRPTATTGRERPSETTAAPGASHAARRARDH